MSHTVMVILAGLVMLGIMLGTAKGNFAGAVKRFIPLWLLLSVVNMLVGIYSAGYSFREELPILALVFAVPAAVAVAARFILVKRT